MKPTCARILWLSMVLVPAACTWFEGQPVSNVQLHVGAGFHGDGAEHENELGYVVRMDRAVLMIHGATLVASAEEEVVEETHVGHVHQHLHSHGEEETAETTEATGITVHGELDVDVLSHHPAAFPELEAPEGNYTAVELPPPALHLEGTVRGNSLVDVPFHLHMHDLVEHPLTATGDLTVGQEHAPLILATVHIHLPAHLLHDVDFAELAMVDGVLVLDEEHTPEILEEIRVHLAHELTVMLDVERDEDLNLLHRPEPFLPTWQDLGW